MRFLRTVTALAFSALLLGAGQASATTITFEEIPGFGGPPVDGMTISTQFFGAYGVSFYLIDNNPGVNIIGSPVLAKVGPSQTAFAGPPAQSSPDAIFTGVDQGVGNFFLTDDGILAAQPIRLLINYAAPVYEASGQMIDVDADPSETEAWQIDAYDGINGSGSLLGTYLISALSAGAGQPLGNQTNTGDGTVSPFMFTGIGGVESLIITYTGIGTAVNIGFAFDNFSPPDLSSCFGGVGTGCDTDPNPPSLDEFVPAPEPSTVTLSLLGLGYLAYRRHRQSRKNVA
jgi:hypothetical protein